MPPVLADRARKARRASRLSCGCYVLPGHLIARAGGRWICAECLLAARRRHPAGKAKPPCPTTAT